MKKRSHPLRGLAVMLTTVVLGLASIGIAPSASLADPPICPCFPDGDAIRAGQDAFKSMFSGAMCSCEAIPDKGRTQIFVKSCFTPSTDGPEILWEGDADRLRCIRDTTAIGGDAEVLPILGSQARACIRLLKKVCGAENLPFR